MIRLVTAGLMSSALMLAACARYAPLPLAAGVADADPAIVARDAAAIDRPYLKPAAIDLAAPLDDDAIAVLAVLNNPELKALRTKAGVADAQVFSARLMPDPSFSLGVMPILSGEDPVGEIAGALGLDLAALRTGAVRRRQAEAQATQVRLDIAWAEWQTAGQARLQAARIRRLERTVVLAQTAQRGAASLLARTLRAAGRGDIAAGPVQTARAGDAAARARLTTAEHDFATARLDLVKLLGLRPETRLGLAPARDSGVTPSADALLTIALANRADLAALRTGYDAQEASVHKAVLDQFPSLALNLGVTRDTGKNLITGPTVDFTLPLWNRNRGGIAVERATREQLRSEYDARLFQTRADIAAGVAALATARRQRDTVTAELPGLTRFAAATRRAADRGDLPPTTAEAAEATLGDKQAALVAADQAIDEAIIALELLTGVPKEDWT